MPIQSSALGRTLARDRPDLHGAGAAEDQRQLVGDYRDPLCRVTDDGDDLRQVLGATVLAVGPPAPGGAIAVVAHDQPSPPERVDEAGRAQGRRRFLSPARRRPRSSARR
jgi:hypothetical protein